MPSAPACAASRAARTGSGCRPPRALRMVATWSMLTPRRSGRWAMLIGSAARALDRVDHRRRAQGGDEVGEMAHVGHLDIDQDLEEIGRAVGDLQVGDVAVLLADDGGEAADRKSTRLNSSHDQISYAVFCLKKKKKQNITVTIGSQY